MDSEKKEYSTYCMGIKRVNIIDQNFFTEDKLKEWSLFIAKCCRDICEELIAKIDPVCHVTYFLNRALLKEVVGDATIGMAKIVEKSPHPVECPNAFKIASYLGYWFLRHKPISVIYPSSIDLDDIKVAPDVTCNPEYLSWQLKHINESIAVNIVTTFIFDFENELCNLKKCEKIKKKNIFEGKPAFAFENFIHQRQIMLQKLTYYFTYRAIAPKVIEHMLEGYAFHPAWYLTGPHWNTEIAGDITSTNYKAENG